MNGIFKRKGNVDFSGLIWQRNKLQSFVAGSLNGIDTDEVV
ncbi:hypothetical protein N9A94_01160 [Akkermansiaceae bacterium]|nr:hypothetical protein [Akkermansiaceae bacterium]MDB4537071.1 hypothetical protein [Akkermansiaceae bacterium]